MIDDHHTALARDVLWHLSDDSDEIARVGARLAGDDGMISEVARLAASGDRARLARLLMGDATWVEAQQAADEVLQAFEEAREAVTMHDGSMTGRLELRLSPAQREAWERAATEERRSLSDWLRLVADDAAREAERRRRNHVDY